MSRVMEFYVPVRNGGKTLRAAAKREEKSGKEKSRGVREQVSLRGPLAQLFCSFEFLICPLLSCRAISLKARLAKIPTRIRIKLYANRNLSRDRNRCASRREDKDREMNRIKVKKKKIE